MTLHTTLTCAAILLSAVTVAGPLASSSPAAAATIANCSAANTFVWAAFDGNGTAGTTYYALEFSNVGSKACTLRGDASVWAVGKAGLQLGKPASHQGVPSTVTLAHDGTAHAILGVVDKDEVEYFPVEVCAHQSSMNVLPVRSGTGIPLHTTS
jgi:hypothetical protein